MANTRATLLDTIATQLETLNTVRVATRVLLAPADARKQAPYIGIIPTTERVVVEDATDIRYELDVAFILLTPNDQIEPMLDAVKGLLYGVSFASTIGALAVAITGEEAVNLINDDKFSSAHIAITVIYVASKASF